MKNTNPNPAPLPARTPSDMRAAYRKYMLAAIYESINGGTKGNAMVDHLALLAAMCDFTTGDVGPENEDNSPAWIKFLDKNGAFVQHHREHDDFRRYYDTHVLRLVGRF